MSEVDIVLPTVRFEKLEKHKFSIFQQKWKTAAKNATQLSRFPLWPLDFREISVDKPRQPFCCSLCCFRSSKEADVQNHYLQVHRDAGVVVGEYLYMPCMKPTCIEVNDFLSLNASSKKQASPHYHCLECQYTSEDVADVAAHVQNHGPGLVPAGLEDGDLEFMWEGRTSTVLNDTSNFKPMFVSDVEGDATVTSSVAHEGNCTENSSSVVKSSVCPRLDDCVTDDFCDYRDMESESNPSQCTPNSPRCDIPPPTPPRRPSSGFLSSALSSSSSVMPFNSAETKHVSSNGRLAQSRVKFSDEVSVIYYPLVRAYLEKLGHPGTQGVPELEPITRRTRSQSQSKEREKNKAKVQKKSTLKSKKGSEEQNKKKDEEVVSSQESQDSKDIDKKEQKNENETPENIKVEHSPITKHEVKNNKNKPNKSNKHNILVLYERVQELEKNATLMVQKISSLEEDNRTKELRIVELEKIVGVKKGVENSEARSGKRKSTDGDITSFFQECTGPNKRPKA